MLNDDKVILPEVIVYAGPNGSVKSTITKMAKTVGVYINADDIKKASLCSDLEAAVKAEELREKVLESGLINKSKGKGVFHSLYLCINIKAGDKYFKS